MYTWDRRLMFLPLPSALTTEAGQHLPFHIKTFCYLYSWKVSTVFTVTCKFHQSYFIVLYVKIFIPITYSLANFVASSLLPNFLVNFSFCFIVSTILFCFSAILCRIHMLTIIFTQMTHSTMLQNSLSCIDI